MVHSVLLYAIGDIHGHVEKLRRLVDRCRRDFSERGAERMRLVLVGDYIDRGPSSREVVEQLMNLQTGAGQETICLKGNHEAVLVAAARGKLSDLGDVRMEEWLAQGGGAATLASYGVAHASEIPSRHLAWMDTLIWHYDDGYRYFVHAGVNPEITLAELPEREALWIREPFLSSTKDYGRLIVHGHTPIFTGRPELRHNRLNLDTAAGYGGPISAAIFDSGGGAPIGFIIE